MSVEDPHKFEVRHKNNGVLIDNGELSPEPASAAPLPALVTRALTFLRLRRDDQLELTEAADGSGGRGYFLSLLAFVIIPSLAIAAYFTLVASQQYVSESRFAVRTAESAPDTRGSNSSVLSVGGLPALSGQDAYVITSYIHSRTILDDLSKTIDLRAIFRRQNTDFWARLKANASAEEVTKYWDNMVATYVDGPSGIVTLDVRTFRPQDSLQLSKVILAASEKLANSLSEHIRDLRMRRAADEVRRTEENVREALANLQKFRNKVGYIDPLSSATSSSKLLLGLLTQRSQLQNNIFVGTSTMSPGAPTLVAARAQLVSLNQQIEQLRGELTSRTQNQKSLTSTLAEYEQLDLKRQFAEKLYALAQASLETDRAIAQAQAVFVSVFVPPALPEQSNYPKRFSFSLIFAISALAIWGIFALLAAAIEDHQF